MDDARVSPPNPAVLAAYAAIYAGLTRERLEEVRGLVMPDVRFKDPFNDLRGVDAMIRAMAAMFRFGTPHFEIRDKAASDQAAYLLWRYTTDRGKPGAWVIDGMTELRFAADGRIAAHIDHWDAAAQVYERVPLVGAVLRLLKRRLHVA